MLKSFSFFFAIALIATGVNAQNNGIYQGSGLVPNNTRAKLIGNFLIGDLLDSTAEAGTYLYFSKANQRIHLISQGFVRIGDPNAQSTFPAWLEVNSQSGTIMHYASTDQLFQSDTFLYSLHRGGIQLPNNIFNTPFLLQGDKGMLYYNSTTNRPYFWTGTQHRPIAFTDEHVQDYIIVTESTSIGAASTGIIYAQASTSVIEIALPPVALFDKRELLIKHVGTGSTVSIAPTSGNTINGSIESIILEPGKGVRLHATSIGWQVIGTI